MHKDDVADMQQKYKLLTPVELYQEVLKVFEAYRDQKKPGLFIGADKGNSFFKNVGYFYEYVASSHSTMT